MVYILLFFLSLKCSLFHNSNLFGTCIIHILYTGCAKIKKNNSGPKSLISFVQQLNRGSIKCVLAVVLITVTAEQMVHNHLLFGVKRGHEYTYILEFRVKYCHEVTYRYGHSGSL